MGNRFLQTGGAAVLVLALIAFSTPASANWDTKEYDPKEKTEKLKDKLNLSDEQAAKVQAVYEKYNPKNDAELQKLKDEMYRLHESMEKKMDERHAQKQAEISALLDDKQKAKYEELTAKMKEKMEKKHGKKDGKKHSCH